MQESKHVRRAEPNHLPPDAPNILIVLLDDVGFGLADTLGGEVHTPTLTRLANDGVAFNQFHTTSICSPTRAALLTGRNHQRVGSGTIAERALDFDGYTGVIPKSAATVATVLRDYGYKTSAFGKWHNTPATETTAMGPFDRWPTGYGFDYFYGFMAGETSQYEPRLFENTIPIEPPHDPTYHLSSDMADKALAWLRKHRSFAPDKPFLMYWAPGAAHGPHHVFKEWADKYKGKFDDGWDAYRERVFKRQKDIGWIPPDTKLTPRADTMASWDSIPELQRPFQRRLMEVFAGFLEHVDAQVGRLVDGLDEMKIRDNTIIFYVFGDNGSSAEGQNGTISELLAQNMIPNTIEQQLAALDKIGGLDALGTAKTDNMYHAGWAWAGDTPFRYTKLVASHFGGTRNPLVVSWPKGIKPDKTPRPQFHHVNDIAPTIYDIFGSSRPTWSTDGAVADRRRQHDLCLRRPQSAGSKADPVFREQRQPRHLPRRLDRRRFWSADPLASRHAGLDTWDANKDRWELYDIRNDFSEADDLAAQEPERLEEMKKLFLTEAKDNQVFPVGAGLWTRLHPEDRVKVPYTHWDFDFTTTRLPEFAGPGLGRESNRVVVELETDESASGVIYALGGIGGGLTLYMDKGELVYEYNMMMIERYIGRSARADRRRQASDRGRHVDRQARRPRRRRDHGRRSGGDPRRGQADRRRRVSPPAKLFDVGVDLGSPVSFDYFDRQPFAFNGKIGAVTVDLK